MRGMRLGVFGGTFNPVHYGHLRAAEEAREVLALSKVLFIPSGNPPLKSAGLAPAPDRLEMTRLAVSGNPFFEVLDIECLTEGKSYSVNTVESLLDQYPSAEMFFLLGVDAFSDLPNWWRPGRLISLVNFGILRRPGSRFAELALSPYVAADRELLDRMDVGGASSLRLPLASSKEAVLIGNTSIPISATDIRRLIRGGSSVKYLLPENVESFIISKRLYRGPDKRGREISRKAGQTFRQQGVGTQGSSGSPRKKGR